MGVLQNYDLGFERTAQIKANAQRRVNLAPTTKLCQNLPLKRQRGRDGLDAASRRGRPGVPQPPFPLRFVFAVAVAQKQRSRGGKGRGRVSVVHVCSSRPARKRVKEDAGSRKNAPQGSRRAPAAGFGRRAPTTSRTLPRPRPPGGPAPRGFPATRAHLHGAAPPPLPLAGAAPRPLPPHRGRVPRPEPPGGAGSGRTVKPRRRRRRLGQERGALCRRVSGAPGGGGGRAASDHFSSPHHGRTEGAAAEGSQGAPAGEWPAASQWGAAGVGSPLPGTEAARGGRSAGDRRGCVRAGRPTGSSLAPRILGAVGRRVPAPDCALGQGSDRSQI